MRTALADVRAVYDRLKPFEQKDLMRLVLRKAEVRDREMVLELYPIHIPELEMAQSRLRCEAPDRLPGLVPHSMIKDVLQVRLPSLAQRSLNKISQRAERKRAAIASEWRRALHEGLVQNRAEPARREGLSRARITQVLGPVKRRTTSPSAP